MKPSKNKIFCKDSNRAKMLFETEKKANTFIKFNSEEIENQSGYAPSRSYFCMYCNGWHITSKAVAFNAPSKTEKVIEMYNKQIEKIEYNKQLKKIEKEEKKNIENERLEKILTEIERNVTKIKELHSQGQFAQCIELIKKEYPQILIFKKKPLLKKRLVFLEEIVSHIFSDCSKK